MLHAQLDSFFLLPENGSTKLDIRMYFCWGSIKVLYVRPMYKIYLMTIKNWLQSYLPQGSLVRGRSQLSTFMKAQRTLGGRGSGTSVRFPPENQNLFLITDNVL